VARSESGVKSTYERVGGNSKTAERGWRRSTPTLVRARCTRLERSVFQRAALISIFSLSS
jgi:hypothetical protein